MSALSKIVVILSCLYLLHLAVLTPQFAPYRNGKYQTLKMVLVSGLAAISLLAVGVYFRLILP